MTTSPQENAADGPLWTPSAEAIAQSNVTAFSRQAEHDWGVTLPDWWALLDWSVEHPEDFFKSLWSFTGVIAETQGDTVLADGDKMPGARWFPEARLNFAENLLRRRDDATAIEGYGHAECDAGISEGVDVPVTWRGKDLTALVGQRVRLLLKITYATVYAYRFTSA